MVKRIQKQVQRPPRPDEPIEDLVYSDVDSGEVVKKVVELLVKIDEVME